MNNIKLYDVIQSELIKQGHSEFMDDEGNWLFYNKEHQFIQKILRYDDIIHEITTLVFFHGLRLDDEIHDKHFKRAWLSKFYNREINRQTLEAFSSKVIETFLTNDKSLNNWYEHFDKYLLGERLSDNTSDTLTENTSKTFADNRNATQSQAQNKVNLDVDNHLLDYADDFTVNRQSNENDNLTENKTKNKSTEKDYNIERLQTMNLLLEHILLKFDKNCFSQIW